MFAIGLQLEAINTAASSPAVGERLSEICKEMDEVIQTIRSTIFALRSSEHDRAPAP